MIALLSGHRPCRVAALAYIAHDPDVESNALLDSDSESQSWLGPASPHPMYPRISLEGLSGRATNLTETKMRYRQDDGAGPRFFFFLIGLELLMVWLTQQL
jgi:hypothetical protein